MSFSDDRMWLRRDETLCRSIRFRKPIIGEWLADWVTTSSIEWAEFLPIPSVTRERRETMAPALTWKPAILRSL